MKAAQNVLTVVGMIALAAIITYVVVYAGVTGYRDAHSRGKFNLRKGGKR